MDITFIPNDVSNRYASVASWEQPMRKQIAVTAEVIHPFLFITSDGYSKGEFVTADPQSGRTLSDMSSRTMRSAGHFMTKG